MSTEESFACIRCGRSEGRLAGPPIPGEIGQEILEKTCASCWHEWQNVEVMVINELRLNFMDPRAQEILSQHMREFLMLDGGV
jgi:Fe-S cluster biosynthesis and repair protein YggX